MGSPIAAVVSFDDSAPNDVLGTRSKRFGFTSRSLGVCDCSLRILLYLFAPRSTFKAMTTARASMSLLCPGRDQRCYLVHLDRPLKNGACSVSSSVISQDPYTVLLQSLGPGTLKWTLPRQLCLSLPDPMVHCPRPIARRFVPRAAFILFFPSFF